MVLGASLHSFVGYGVGYWIPAFLIRSHGLGTGIIGTWLFYLGFAGLIGTFLGGYIADRLAVRDVRWYVWLPGGATFVALPFSVFFYLWPDYRVGLAVASVATLLGSYYLGPTFALTQAMATLRMRALAASIMLFITNLIGMGLGPQFTGILSDLLSTYTSLGTDSLRFALLGVLTANVASTICYFVAAKDLKQDLASVRRD